MFKKLFILLAILLVAFGAMMATTGNSMFVAEDSATIKAPADQIWTQLTAVSAWPEWWPGVETARVTPNLHPGARLDIVFQGATSSEPATIETVVPEGRLSWVREGVLGSTARTTISLASDEKGTKVTLQSTIRGPQAFLARMTRQEDFAEYQERVLSAIGSRLGQYR